MWAKHKQPGFTIVELLIVIVVIGILAAVTVVAYSGIQQRAQAATVQSDLEAAAKQLAMDQVTSSTYPTTVALANNGAGLKASNGTTYQYTVNNAVNPQTYCITATNSTTSYFVSSTNNVPTSGACPGHGVGGVAAVINLASNPRAVANSLANGTFGWTWRWAGAGGTQTGSYVTGASDGPVSGVSSYIRKTWTSIGTGLQDIAYSYSNTGTAGYSVQPGDTYTISSYFRFSRTVSINNTVDSIQFDWYDSIGTKLSSSRPNIPLTTANANTWYRVTGTATAPANAAYLSAYHDIYLSSALALSVGDTLDGTALMVTKDGNTYNYVDPITSPLWVWNGATNSSTSTGPAS